MSGGGAGAQLIGVDVPLWHAFDLALLDLDGVVYIGLDPVPGAPEALHRARGQGMRMCFVTNNASRPAPVVADHLRRLGVEAADEEVMTSAMAAAGLLARRHPAGSPVLVIGGEGLYWALRRVGLAPVADLEAAGGRPVAVVQGFHPDVGWRLLAEGTRAVRDGVPWLATNTDLTVPTPFGPAPGNGTLVAAVSTASGVVPEVAGKPQPALFEEAVRTFGARSPLVVGDRLDTDLEGARAAGIPGLLVLTGVTDVPGLLRAAPHRRPDLVTADLDGLSRPHPAAVGRARTGGAAVASGECRDARVSVVADVATGSTGPLLRVVVDALGQDRLDLVRAAAVAAWAAGDPPSSDAPASAPAAASRDSDVDFDLADLLGALSSLPPSGAASA